MGRKALCVGIDCYEHIQDLYGCVNDANSVRSVLERNGDSTINFEVELMCATSEKTYITRRELKDSITALFQGDPEIALFYYSGHGSFTSTGGYLCTSEVERTDEGMSLSDLMTIASKSHAKNKVIILDSCFSGLVGTNISFPGFSEISEGTTILAACGKDEYATEENGHGIFTELLVEALYGGAMNLLGDVSPGSIYSYVDQALGSWGQRPMFKANISSFVSLRKNMPPIEHVLLLQLADIFSDPAQEYPLNPSYEPNKNEIENKSHDYEHERIFKILQKYERLHLVVPVGEDHMYYAAIHNKSCKLTAKGQHYWNLVHDKKI